MEDADVVMEDVGAPERQHIERQDFGPPQPPEPFPAPVIRPAYRGQRLRVNGRNCHRFRIHLESGDPPVLAYLRCEYSHNPGYAYVKCPSVETEEPPQKKTKVTGNSTNLPKIFKSSRGTVFRARLYERVASSGCETVADNGKYRDTGRTVMIMKVPKAENVSVEVSVAQNFGDDVHILRMIEVLEDNHFYYMVMKDLAQLPVPTNQLPVPTKNQLPVPPLGVQPGLNLNLLRTLVKNLVYLQKHGIIHRDLSPQNVTCDRTHCPIIGFALALQCRALQGNWLPIPPGQDVCGAPSHRSFEVAEIEALDFGVDVWALGCTLFFLWTGVTLYEHPFDRSWDLFFASREDIFLNATAFSPDPPDFIQEFIIAYDKIRRVREELSVEQRGLLSRMFNIDRTRRISAEGILQHEILHPILGM